jgi:MFS family permease
MRDQFGFGNLGNLFMCALNGFVYMFAAQFGGRFAQRHGYFFALRIGFSVMAVALVLGSLTRTVEQSLATMILWTLGMCFTWPTLEAIISEQEPPARLQRLLGIYNVVWASASALAYFSGGAMLEKLGPLSIFLVPAAIHVTQLVLLARLARMNRHATSAPAVSALPGRPAGLTPRHSPVPPATFLKMALLANPFAYLAMNALLPVIPQLSAKLGLSPMLAGFFCSVWFFARAASFVALWQWTGWHYRFRWLASAYVAMGFCFAVILLDTHLWLLVLAQLVFGASVGLLYYSSLFYSMDVGETKGEHGGVHESAIGAGICAGPAVGAAALRFFPEQPNMNIWAVSGLLAIGFLVLQRLRHRRAG